MSLGAKLLMSLVAGTTVILGHIPASAQDSTENSAANPAAPPTQALWLADFAAIQRLDEQAGLAAKDGNFAAAASYWQRAARLSENIRGKLGGWMAFRAAVAFARSNQQGPALRALSMAASQGFRYVDNIVESRDFAALDSPALQSIIADARKNDAKYRAKRSLPEDANLVSADISRFWAAYDMMAKTKRRSEKAALLRKYYLAPGSSGLIDYHWLKTQSMELLVDRIEKSPEYYDGIRSTTLMVESYEPQIRNAFARVKSLYPDAYFPDVTFVMGRLNSGGTAGASGMLIGVEVWSWSEGVSLTGISPGFQKIVTNYSLETLPYVVVHEQMHAMQNYTGKETLLKAALQEGSADFITMLALPDSAPPAHYRWGLEHEAAIWSRFSEQMSGKDLGEWIGNNGKATEQWPADLGYFVGARISQAYYDQAGDKTQAIHDLLNVSDPQKILEASEYAAGFPG